MLAAAVCRMPLAAHSPSGLRTHPTMGAKEGLGQDSHHTSHCLGGEAALRRCGVVARPGFGVEGVGGGERWGVAGGLCGPLPGWSKELQDMTPRANCCHNSGVPSQPPPHQPPTTGSGGSCWVPIIGLQGTVIPPHVCLSPHPELRVDAVQAPFPKRGCEDPEGPREGGEWPYQEELVCWKFPRWSPRVRGSQAATFWSCWHLSEEDS